MTKRDLQKIKTPATLILVDGSKVTAVPAFTEDGNVALRTGRRGRPRVVAPKDIVSAA